MQTNLINSIELEKYSKEQLESKFSKKELEALELILDIQNNFKLVYNNTLLDYQNTNFENYPFILKDFASYIF